MLLSDGSVAAALLDTERRVIFVAQREEEIEKKKTYL